MQPRVIAIANDTSGDFEEGNIIEQSDDGIYRIETAEGNKSFEPAKFPHLFRKLNWWEYRDEVDMPEYVKTRGGNSVRKVYHFDTNYNKVIFEGGRIRPLNKWLPSNKNEYDKYMASRP